MAEFTRLDDEDEVLEDACAEVAASVERLRTSLRPLEGPLPPAAVDQTLTLCAPPRQRVCVHGARAHRRRAALTSVARALAGRERLGAALRELREFEVELDGTATCGKHLTQPLALRRLVLAPEHACGWLLVASASLGQFRAGRAYRPCFRIRYRVPRRPAGVHRAQQDGRAPGALHLNPDPDPDPNINPHPHPHPDQARFGLTLALAPAPTLTLGQGQGQGQP